MQRSVTRVLGGVLTVVLASSAAPCVAQTPALLDTDMNSDCDDAGALAVLHALADRGGLKILGIASCTDKKSSAPAIEVINTYYGRADIPIAQIKQPLGFTPNKK